jgi:hypothetical protein
LDAMVQEISDYFEGANFLFGKTYIESNQSHDSQNHGVLVLVTGTVQLEVSDVFSTALGPRGTEKRVVRQNVCCRVNQGGPSHRPSSLRFRRRGFLFSMTFSTTSQPRFPR